MLRYVRNGNVAHFSLFWHVALQAVQGYLLLKQGDCTVSQMQKYYLYRYLRMGKQGLEKRILWERQPQ